jgi:3-methyladenine DNA glycosylase AlkC
MATQLKHFFNRRVVEAIASQLASSIPKFRQADFVRKCMHGMETLELTARGRHIAAAMHEFLPQPFEVAVKALTTEVSTPPNGEGSNGMASFFYLPHMFYIATYGTNDLEASMNAQYVLTQRFTAEFTIRVFIEKYPKETYARLQQWAKDPSAHVRRLVSEGTRPRLPWAPRLVAYQKDPTPVIALLELLKDDADRYVQRSVANNLNDIAKDHPELVLQLCTRWLKKASDGRRWIVRHATRSLVKQGVPGALALQGVGNTPELKVTKKQLPKSVVIGDKLSFTFELESTSTHRQDLQVDFRVHFVKANGSTQIKVFKLRRLSLEPAARTALRTSVSFAQLTTRKHYPGAHAIDLFVNGVVLKLGQVQVVAAGS